MKKVHVNGIRVVGVVGFIVIFLVFVTIPPNVINDVSDNQTVTYLESAEDIINDVKTISHVSIVETDIDFTESNDSLLTQFLDSRDIDSPLSSEKFAIVTDVALFDSNNQKSSTTNIFGINELPNTMAVLDESGKPLDFGGYVQVTFDSITQSLPKSVTSWGTVKFFLDDKLLDTKKIWSSYQNTQKQSMSVLSNLSLQSNPSNLSNLALKEFPVSPSFSEREKKNFTYNFSDDNLTDGLHIFRVVFYDINAVVDASNFDWVGEDIVYELKFNVDNNMITKISEIGNGEKSTTYKSDNRFYWTKRNHDVQWMNNEQKFHFIAPTTFPHVMNFYIDGKLVNTADNSMEDSHFWFPRNSQLKVTVDGVVVYDEKQPLSQINHFVEVRSELLRGYVYDRSCQTSFGEVFVSGSLIGGDYKNIVTSSIGYSDEFTYHYGSTTNKRSPC